MEPGMVNPEPTMAAPEPVIELGGQKKSKAPVIVAVLCVILAVAGIGFGVFEMIQNKKVEDLKVEIENKDGTKTELETDKIIVSDDSKTITIKDSKVDDYTIYRELARKYVEWDFTDMKIVEDALSGDISPSYMAYVSTGAADVNGMSWVDSMQTSNLTHAAAQYFEREIELSDELQFRCQAFNKIEDSYRSVVGGCGGIGSYYSVFDVISVEEKGDSLKIEVSYGRIQAGPSGDDVEGSWNGNLFNGEDLVKGAEVPSRGSYMSDSDKKDNELTKYFYEHPDEFNHYTLTFKKAGKRYLLSSSSKAE